MPFRSEKQRSWMWANKPAMARKWTKEHGSTIAKNKGGKMPNVGGQKFPYTSAGVQQAQKHAKNTGQKVNMSGYKKGGKTKKMKSGGAVDDYSFHKEPWVNEYGYPSGGIPIKHNKQEVQMNLLKDIWAHLKEWNEWKMKDWIKAGIVAIIVLIVLKAVILPGA